jgi:hypothetical protein
METLHWSIERASREFNLAPVTLSKFLRQSDIVPDESGCFTTAQLCSAIYGDLRAERLRKERELTKRYRIENEVSEGNLLNRASVTASLAEMADAMKQAVMNSGMPREACENFLRNLATWPVRLQTVARAQSKRPRRSNGETEEE